MSGVRARMAGLERLAPQVRQLVTAAGGHMKALLLEGAEAVAANARARVLTLKDEAGPSALAESIRVEETEDGAVVSAGVPYAPYVEFGTQRVAAQPFLTPAMEEARPGIVERAGRLMALGDEA